jgi:23S rRNA pseudouridine2457 synthase
MPRYLIFHKPYGVLTQFTDAENRPTLADYIDAPGVYAAGRLDKDSEGLLLLTDDGIVLHRVTHPRWKLPKVYLAQVEGTPDELDLQKLREGVVIKGKKTAPAQVELLPAEPDLPQRAVRQYHPTPWLRIVLKEGKKRQVRRMTAAVGHPTLRLVRVAIGPLTLGKLAPGQWRSLSEDELQNLFRALKLIPSRSRHSSRQSPHKRARKK